MSEETVKQFAARIGFPVDRLQELLKSAGIELTGGTEAEISEQDKTRLLEFIRSSRQKDSKASAETAAEPTPASTEATTTARPVAKPKAATVVRTGKSAVNVEVKRKRVVVRPDQTAPEKPVTASVVNEQATAPKPAAAPRSNVARTRTPTEAKAGAKVVSDEARRRAELEAMRAEQESRRAAEHEELERQAVEQRLQREKEEAERKIAEEAAAQAAAEAEAAAAAAAKAQATAATAEQPRAEQSPSIKDNDNLEASSQTEPKKAKDTALKPKKAAKKAAEPIERNADAPRKAVRKDSGKERERPLSAYALDDDDQDGDVGRGPRRRRKPKIKVQEQHAFTKPTAPVIHEVMIPENITVSELANRMSIKGAAVIKELFKQGMMVTINQVLDRDTAMLIVEEMGHTPVAEDMRAVDDVLMDEIKEQEDRYEALPRPPVVTIMGHVDHGKTSLLDYIRRTRVVAGEAGGITQHIGAYHVETSKGTITFLDTPGHAAFSSMRARGAQITDIVILVVAADDGVMPQTIEAIQHARAAGVPLIVAINKIDKPEANSDRVMQELTQHEVVSEEWGGDTMMVQVSAKAGTGIDELLDAILLQAEVLELKAPKDGPAWGTIIESQLDRGRGAVATVLVQKGTLHQGDIIVTGQEFGRVRAMFDEAGKPVEFAGPSLPVQILGLSGVPDSGDETIVVDDERRARDVADSRAQRLRKSRLDEQHGVRLDNLFNKMSEGQLKHVNIILKADVQGSLEAIKDSLMKIHSDEVRLVIVAAGVGGINESDANLAATSDAIILGFNVRADALARRVIEDRNLDLRYYSIIYELLDDVKKAISGLLSPIVTEEIIGLAEVKDVFRSSKFGAIAGSIVVDGVVKRNNPIRVLRDNVVIYEGALESLRRFKDDVSEVRAGTECGIGVKNYNDIKSGDQIEVFERTERAREL